MVTKIEIEQEMNEKIKESNKELILLNEEHKKFEKEHEEDKKRGEEYNKISRFRDSLLSKKWEGNFGSRNNWYRGEVPHEFNFNEEDKREIENALNEIASEKEKEIVATEEYQELDKKYDEVCFSKFSEEHRELDDKIKRANNIITWSQHKISEIQNRGKLIEECKRRKKDWKWGEEKRVKSEKIEKYKQMILEKVIKTKQFANQKDSEVKN